MNPLTPPRTFYLGVAWLYAANSLFLTLLLWQMLAITHSPIWVSIAVATGAVPTVIIGLTGPEWGTRGRMALWLAALGILMAIGAPAIARSPWGLVGAALLEGWINAGVVPKAQAWLMVHVPPDETPTASSRFEVASRTGMVAGPLLGGASLTVLGATGATCLTAALFVAAAVAWWSLQDVRQAHQRQSARRQDAWQAIRQDRFLMTALSVRAGSNLLWPAFTVAIPLLIVHPWHAHALGYGAIRTLWGLSTVLGTIVIIPRLLKHLKASYFLSWVLTGAAFCGIGQSTHLRAAFVWVAVGALSSPVVHVALDSHIGTQIPSRDQSAVFAIQRLVMAVVSLAGLAMISVVFKHATPGQTLSGAGLLMSGAALAGWVLWNRRAATASVRHCE